MQTFAAVYLIGYIIDALMSWVATFRPTMEGASNIISAVVSMANLVVFVLACLGKLRPRRIYLVLSYYYLLMMGFGVMLGVLLVLKLGPDMATHKMTIAFFRDQFSWYMTAHWTFLTVWTLIALYGLYARFLGSRGTETAAYVGPAVRQGKSGEPRS